MKDLAGGPSGTFTVKSEKRDRWVWPKDGVSKDGQEGPQMATMQDNEISDDDKDKARHALQYSARLANQM